MLKAISKLNPRQLFIHFIASWLFIYAIHTLFTLFDYDFLYTKGQPLISPLVVQMKFNKDLLIINEGGIAGLLIAYIIAWQVSYKQKWYWLNSVIVLLIMFPLALFDWLGWKQLRTICMYPGLIFGENTKSYLIANSSIMLGVALLLFFQKNITNFISKGIKIPN